MRVLDDSCHLLLEFALGHHPSDPIGDGVPTCRVVVGLFSYVGGTGCGALAIVVGGEGSSCFEEVSGKIGDLTTVLVHEVFGCPWGQRDPAERGPLVPAPRRQIFRGEGQPGRRKRLRWHWTEGGDGNNWMVGVIGLGLDTQVGLGPTP